jgi:four helix bundle protein
MTLKNPVKIGVKQLPDEERFNLVSQMRRAATSVTNNIAEAHGRYHYQESIQFCRQSRGSVSELIDDLNICSDQSYCSAELIKELKEDAYRVIKLLNGCVAYLQKRKSGDRPSE